MAKLQLSELIGNENIRTQLIIANGAAKLHNQAMGHTLFSGLAGCGKTSSARALAALAKSTFFEVSAESVRSAEDLAELFAKFSEEGYAIPSGEKIGVISPPIVFIDEAHRLSLKSQELLGIAMENFYHTFVRGRGKKKQTVTAWVPEFTLVCATTKEGELSKPFRDRFKFNFVFGDYNFDESVQILKLHASKMGLDIDEDCLGAIAKRGRGTPRILVKFLSNMRDGMAFMGRPKITLDLVDAQFNIMGIDKIGLTNTDTVILMELYGSEYPKGIDSLAVKTNLDPRTISEVNEPYLIRLGFIERTKGGRVITELGEEHLIRNGHVKAPQKEPGHSRVVSVKQG